MAGSGSRPRNGGIRKHQQRRDRDGDVSMGAAPRASSARPPARNNANGSGPRSNSTNTPGFTELKVTGWTDTKEMSKLLGFLERHSARRSTHVSKGSAPPKMIKRHKVSDTLLTIWVRPEDVTAFSKINGFSFASQHGSQKLTITGPGIRSKSPNAANAMDTTSAPGNQNKPGSETLEVLKGFLERRYNPTEKLLNLSVIADDEEVARIGMWKHASTQAKFFPALMVVCNQVLKTAEEKREAVHSVTLAGNNLPNLENVHKLVETFPHIKNLDLSGNKFSTTRDLKVWKNRFRFLEHLIVEIAQPGWEDEIVSWFPRLRILNGQQVRPDRVDAPSTTTTTAAAPVPTPTPAVPVPIPTQAQVQAPVFTQEQEAMIVYVQKETNLKREVAVQCLEAGNWNIETAAHLFLQQKDTLPATSFN